MLFSFYTAKRISSGKGSFSSFIIKTGVAAVAISVAVMIVSIGIMQGYKKEITAKLSGFSGHLQIKALTFNESFEAIPILVNDSLIEQIGRVNRVNSVSRFAHKAGIIKSSEDIEGIILKGIDHQYPKTFLDATLKKGRLPGLSDSILLNEVMVSQYTADKMNLDTGDKITIYFVQDQNQPVRIRRLQVCGIFETGLENYDKTYGIVDLRHVSSLYNWKNGEVEGLEIQLNDFDAIEGVSVEIERHIPIKWSLTSIKEDKPQIFDWLSLLDMNVLVILILMVLVAGINMITAVAILIVERTAMIGILKALGSTNRQVIEIFLWKSALLIGLGVLIGNALGLGLGIAQQKTAFLALDPASYYLSAVPFNINYQTLFAINLGSLLICLLVLLLPARLILKISPVKAIRFN